MTETYPSMDELDELSFRSYAMFVQSKLMSSIFDLEKLLEVSIDAFVELMRVDVGFIMLFDEKSQQLSVGAVRGMKKHSIRKAKINVDKDIIQGIIERKGAIFLSKLEKETPPIRILFQKIAEKVGGDIVLSIPLVIKKDLLGLVNLSRREFEAPFKQTDLQFLYTLAEQVATAIENTNLYRKKVEEEKLRTKLATYLSPGIVEEIIHAKKELVLGGKCAEVSVLFADIEGFTRMAENMNVDEVVQMLNEFFTMATDIVFRYGGTLDKFLGDGIMVIFGAPYQHDDDAIRAVTAAVEMRAAAEGLFRKRREQDKAPFRIKIGINSGKVIAGNIGSEKRMDYTVIGDTVNVASRLEGKARGG